MKKFLFLILTSVIVSCQSQKKMLDKTVASIEEISYQAWTAGVRGGGAGINFYVNFETPLSEGVQLKKVLFKGKEAVFTTPDSLHYTAHLITKIGGRINVDGEATNEPLPESNAARLYFIINGQSVVYRLENIKERKTLYYPTMNKPGE